MGLLDQIWVSPRLVRSIPQIIGRQKVYLDFSLAQSAHDRSDAHFKPCLSPYQEGEKIIIIMKVREPVNGEKEHFLATNNFDLFDLFG